jgi:DNA-binding GntR family transcriptional regulator
MTGRLQSQLAAQILDHVRERRLPRGQHLPEQALADLFRVSRAPIHAALKALEQRGVVRLERNRGFFLQKGAEELSETEAAAASAAPDEAEDEPYLAVAADRLEGRLPERVTENELIRRYGFTRNQAVKILARIAQEGWAERLPGHGWRFLPVLTSREAYEMGYRFRAAIEAAAVQEPTFHVDPAALADLRAEQRALLDGGVRHLPRTRLFQANSGFHEAVVGWSNNPFFLDALRRVNQVRRLMEYRVTVDRSRLDRQCREHLELLDLLEAGELRTAAAFLRVHIEGARRIKSAGLA